MFTVHCLVTLCYPLEFIFAIFGGQRRTNQLLLYNLSPCTYMWLLPYWTVLYILLVPGYLYPNSLLFCQIGLFLAKWTKFTNLWKLGGSLRAANTSVPGGLSCWKWNDRSNDARTSYRVTLYDMHLDTSNVFRYIFDIPLHSCYLCTVRTSK